MTTPIERLSAVVAARGPEDAELVERALLVAGRAHLGQFRRSGDPYVTHPIAVAGIVAATGAATTTIAAALLHDLPADTPWTVGGIRAEFGDDVADQVGGLVDLDHSCTPADIAVADPRVVLLKVADRLHNMQTIDHLTSAKQHQKSGQTLSLVAPLARDHGLDEIADELEELAAAALERVERRAREGVPPFGSRSTAGLRTCTRFVHGVTWFLPPRCRDRYRSEWEAELHVLATRRERMSFALHLLRALPALSVITRGRGGRP